MTERKIDSEAPEKRQAETPDDKNPPGRPTNDQNEPEVATSRTGAAKSSPAGTSSHISCRSG
ncbi:hypothetical protein [Streptomyces poriferorum]|uniref:Uncharacterized protein n=1 Tax=Streptomyces poriferorum TaxID=2798799 RepID=A0ABY9ISN6_9ACTN|nr:MULTISPECIES: hypothetical protein [unclassified Streptomyces]MDP5312738.1 hypothetical protein [Streptomyces sp. Alt4]WLQ58245.1 hypothetical protein P8A19_23675 [Streptomyces sp. Alt2]